MTVEWAHVVAAGLGLASAAAFLLTAHVVARRTLGGDAAEANRLFALWWLAIGTYAFLVGGVSNALAAFGFLHVPTFAAIRNVAVLLLVAGLFGLTYYFSFLFTGSRRLFLPLSVFYTLVYGVITFAFAGRTVVGVNVGQWDTELIWSPAPEPAMFALVMMLLTLPQLLGAAMYLALAFRLPDRALRYRGALVAASIVLWWGSNFLASLVQDETLQLISRPVLGLVAAGACLAAFRPPAWVRQKLSPATPSLP